MKQLSYEQHCEISDFVSREVIYCVSSLVDTLARTAANFGTLAGGTDYDELMSICVQEDWETPARENGWEEHDGQIMREDGERSGLYAYSWRDACEQDNLDPYTVEAYEHWIVTNGLAARLEEKGEMIGRDICGLTIWGRTTTGQAISMDSVIQNIYNELNNN